MDPIPGGDGADFVPLGVTDAGADGAHSVLHLVWQSAGRLLIRFRRRLSFFLLEEFKPRRHTCALLAEAADVGIRGLVAGIVGR